MTQISLEHLHACKEPKEYNNFEFIIYSYTLFLMNYVYIIFINKLY